MGFSYQRTMSNDGSEFVNAPLKSSTVPPEEPATKTLVRNCVSAPCVRFAVPLESNNSSESESEPDSDDQCKSPSELATPKLQTSLKKVRSISKLSGMSGCRKLTLQTSKSSSQTVKKPLKKINIRFDEQIFKNLIDLRVSEEDLGLPPNFSVKPKEIIKNREPEPVLSDYYTPEFNKEYIIKPNCPVFATSEETHFTGSSVLNATKRWEVDPVQYLF